MWQRPVQGVSDGAFVFLRVAKMKVAGVLSAVLLVGLGYKVQPSRAGVHTRWLSGTWRALRRAAGEGRGTSQIGGCENRNC